MLSKKGVVVAAAVFAGVAHTPYAQAPQPASRRSRAANADGPGWTPLGAYGATTGDPTAAPSPFPSTWVPTSVGAPDGAGWGTGCTSVCDGEFDDIEDMFDDFVAASYRTLRSSFKSARKEINKIVDDASALVLSKVQTKAAAVSHQHARLDATYKVLVDLIGDPDTPEARALVAEHRANLALESGGSGSSTADAPLAALAAAAPREKDVHHAAGVEWSTFAVQAAVALCVGCVVESWRIRSHAAAGLK